MTMNASKLERLPQEIHDMIVELLLDQRDLSNLSKTCKGIYEITVPFLYKSICLYASEHDIENFGVTRFNVAKARGLLRHTQNIKVRSHFKSKRPGRSRTRIPEGSSREVEDLARELKSVFEGCKPGAIRSLEWSLGTCVPQSNALLGPGGYLTLEQQNIESIRLVTDDSCPERLVCQLALDAFPHLKHLSWTGLSGTPDFASLAKVLTQRSHQLEELEIDLTWHQKLNAYRFDSEGVLCIDENVLGSDMMKRRGRTIEAFPVLKRLALVRAPFKDYYYDRGHSLLYDALRRSSLQFLQSLQLRHCYAWEDLIRMFNERAEPVKLKSLELQWTNFNSRRNGAHDLLLAFLRSFQGLEELIIHVTMEIPADLPKILQAALHHRGSLRRFVHQQRAIHYDRLRQLPTLFDRPELGFVHPLDFESGSAHLLGRLDLVTLGLCCVPSSMQSLVSQFASKTSLQVLHMRQSGPDLCDSSWAASAGKDDVPFDFAGMDLPNGPLLKLGRSFVDFAQWVFGPTGIQSLRLLAFGDFSFDGRFDRANLLLCRQDTPRGADDSATDGASRRLNFREVLEGDDVELWELYKREKHVLAACPSDQQFRSP